MKEDYPCLEDDIDEDDNGKGKGKVDDKGKSKDEVDREIKTREQQEKINIAAAAKCFERFNITTEQLEKIAKK